MAEPLNPGPVGLAVKLPFATPEEFLARYGTNVTRGGIYLRSKVVKPPGTLVTLDLKLASGERIIYASAVVHFVTGQQGPDVGGVSGMGLRFVTLDPATKRFLDSAVAALPHAGSSSPPLPAGVGPAQYAESSGAPPASEPNVGIPAASPPAVAPVTPSVAPPANPASNGRPTLTAQKTPVPGPPPAAATAPAVSVSSAVVPSAPAFEAPTEAPKRQGPILGIDLGTTNSCAAVVKDGKPAVLRSREGYNTVPSILALNARGKLVVGHPAKNQMLTNPRQTVYGAKRLVGRSYDSPVVQQMKDRFAYEIAAGTDGSAAVKLGDRVYTLQQISAMLLREVRELAQVQLGQPVSRAVITVPAYYSDSQRQAVREAGRLAGLYVERILNEPTAAALAYGYGRKLKQRVLVYDLGGGTFDASVLELHDDIYEVISTGGDTFLGGIDFDGAIVGHLLKAFSATTGRDFQGDRVAMQRIADAAERAKCALSERSEMRVHVPFVTMHENRPYDLDVQLTRETLVQLTDSLVDRTLQVCREVLDAKGLKPSDIDEVILVGGQSRFPRVHEKITQFFGKTPSKGVHPDEAVALGAALLARSLEMAEGVTLIDVLPMSIGVGLPGGRFKPVLERNTALPATKRYSISTSRNDQAEMELTVFQGDSGNAENNEYLGTLKLTGLPKGPRGSIQVEVAFEVSNEGTLKVTAREASSGREVAATLLIHDSPEALKAKMAADTTGAAGSPGTTQPAQPGQPISKPPVPAAQAQPDAALAAQAVSTAKTGGGFFGWFKRLFS